MEYKQLKSRKFMARCAAEKATNKSKLKNAGVQSVLTTPPSKYWRYSIDKRTIKINYRQIA